jgi:hypothetical protein
MTGFFCVVVRRFRESGHLVVMVTGFGHTPRTPYFLGKNTYIYIKKDSLFMGDQMTRWGESPRYGSFSSGHSRDQK